MIPLPSLFVIVASYLVFMGLNYLTAKHLQRKLLAEKFSAEVAAGPLKLQFHMIENLVWAVLAWAIGWWVIPIYYVIMYPLAIASRLLVGLIIFLLTMVQEHESFKVKPHAEKEEFNTMVARLKALTKARKVPMASKFMWHIHLSAALCTHL